MVTSRLQGLTASAAQQVIAAAQAIETGGPDRAAMHLMPALKAFPGHPEVLRVHAGILNLRGDTIAAVTTMRAAVAGRPDDALYHNTLGTFLSALGDYDGAIETLRHATRLQPDLAVAWFNLGVIMTRCLRHDEAIDALRQAIRSDPNYMPARALLAEQLRTENRVEEAAAEYRRIITEQPWTGMAWWGLADLRSKHLDADDIARLQRALRDDRAKDNDRIAMGFALARALDEQQRYADSLAALREANAIARQRRQWSASLFTSGISLILDCFTPPPDGSPARDLGKDVIFIAGMPRSGSTLVEQILSSHSQVEGPGELPDLPLTLSEETRRRGEAYPYWVTKMRPTDWQRLGERYLQRTARWRQRKPVSTDKLPANWYYLGAIRAMLPAARIIICRRDPLETCFSCYRQHLENNEYTRTFEDLAAYWRDFDRATAQWRRLHPAHVYEHVYEQMLVDPEARIRLLLEFCNLTFEESCLQFHRTQRGVHTPSAMQVRQPLRSDTRHTERYGALLDPLRQALGLSTLGR